MIFVNSPFPECLAFGSQSNAEWFTNLATTSGGFDSTNENWQDARHVFDVSYAVKDTDDYAIARAHFHQVRGRARKFLMKDPLDYEAFITNGAILTLDRAVVSGNGTYYLHKTYGSADPYHRKITRPDTPIQVFRTRSAVTTDITGSDAVVTYDTGAVAITGHMSGDTYTWSGTFKVPVRYDIDRLPGVVIDREPGYNGQLLVRCDSITIVEVKE